jgi:WD40 repeat protein
LDLATGHQRWQARAADDFLMVAVFSPDGRTLATTAGYNEKSIRLWDVSSGKEINRLEGHGSFVYGLVFWPDGKTLASAGTDGTIRVWNLGQLTNVPPSRLVAINNCAEAPLALLPGNTTLVSGAIDGAVQIWDAGRPEPRISPVELPVRIGGAWRFTPDSQSVLTVAGGRVARWFGADFQQTEPVLDVGASFSALFSEDGQTLAVGSEDGTVRLWDLRPRKPLGQFKNPRPASPVKFLSNKQRLVVKDVEFGGALHEWDVATGRETRSWRRPTGFRPERSGNFAFSPDERWFLRVDEVGTGSLFDLVANREINPGFLMKGMYCAAFSRDGRFFAAVGSEVSKLKLWATEDVRELGTLDTSGHSLGFSPDNRRLAVGDLGKNAVAIWDVTGGHRLLASPP